MQCVAIISQSVVMYPMYTALGSLNVLSRPPQTRSLLSGSSIAVAPANSEGKSPEGILTQELVETARRKRSVFQTQVTQRTVLRSNTTVRSLRAKHLSRSRPHL